METFLLAKGYSYVVELYTATGLLREALGAYDELKAGLPRYKSSRTPFSVLGRGGILSPKPVLGLTVLHRS